MAEIIENPHGQGWEEIAESLGVDIEQGLSDKDVKSRLHQYGHNRLKEKKQRSALAILLDQFKSVVLLLLLVAGVVAFAFGEIPEGVAIIAVLVINTLIGFISEIRARRSMQALRALGQQQARLRRKGNEYQLAADKIVPGDILLLEGGDVVPADVRIFEANALRVNEASLTGESVPVLKQEDKLPENTPLAERGNMLYKGTTVTEGSAQGIVTGTGMQTELGRISQLAGAVEEESTPLEMRLNELGRRMAYIVIATAVVLGGVGLLRGKPPMLMIETAIALGVAAIPEGLPVVATIALARGMWLMARRQALINRLAAVETLGSTQVIFTDKTGTLTENQMHVEEVRTAVNTHTFEQGGMPSDCDDPVLRQALLVGVLCSNATLRDEDRDKVPEAMLGDPTETAILRVGLTLDMRREQLLEEYPEEKEYSFDPDRMMMATVHRHNDQFLIAVKGAPEQVLNVCTEVAGEDKNPQKLDDEARRAWVDRAQEMAKRGLRLIITAQKVVDDVDTDPYADLCLLGMIGMLDPPRQGVKEALSACRDAGIKVVMVTGDRAETALAIGEQVGLAGDGDTEDRAMTGTELQQALEAGDDRHEELLRIPVFARVTPEHKLRLLELYQKHGYSVAMTGDGVNDAPALETANIGVAMGQRGTDAARQAADMVLRDDAFSSIVAAVEQGRVIFKNIRKSVMFMLCTNVAEVIAVAVASFIDLPLPLRALQILYLNVITDVFPALALSVGKGSQDVMKEKPRSESVLTRRNWKEIAAWGVIVSACVLAGLLIGQHWLGLSEPAAVTISFLTLAFGKLTFTFNLRDRGSNFLRNDITRNPWVWGATALCIALLLAAVYIPWLSGILNTVAPGFSGWLTIAGLALLPWCIGQVHRSFCGRQ